MLIIGLAGEKLGGKGTASKHLVDTQQAIHYRFSKILDDILDRVYLPHSRENEIAVVQALRQNFGTEILAHVLKKDIESQAPALAVIDGIRFQEELAIVKQLPNFYLVYITAPLEQRFARAKKRGEKADEAEMSFEKFKALETAPTEVKIKELKELADYEINNAGTFDDFYKKINEVYTKICPKPILK